MCDFIKEKSFEERKKEAENMKRKYPDRICIYLSKGRRCDLPDIGKNKFLVPNDLTVGQMLHVVRKRMKINASQSIFLFTESNTLPMSTATMYSVYNDHKNEDGFLYMTYNAEDTFG